MKHGPRASIYRLKKKGSEKMPTIDDLRIEISDNSKQAVSGIDSLTESLSKLKTITRGGVGLNGVANQFKKLSQALQELQDPSEKIKKLVTALKHRNH